MFDDGRKTTTCSGRDLELNELVAHDPVVLHDRRDHGTRGHMVGLDDGHADAEREN
jgi:hypothetical protein